MDKEEKDKVNKEENEMSLPLNKTQKPSFSDFITQHRDKIQELSDANWPKNSDGEYVITKDDPEIQEMYTEFFFKHM